MNSGGGQECLLDKASMDWFYFMRKHFIKIATLSTIFSFSYFFIVNNSELYCGRLVPSDESLGFSSFLVFFSLGMSVLSLRLRTEGAEKALLESRDSLYGQSMFLEDIIIIKMWHLWLFIGVAYFLMSVMTSLFFTIKIILVFNCIDWFFDF